MRQEEVVQGALSEAIYRGWVLSPGNPAVRFTVKNMDDITIFFSSGVLHTPFSGLVINKQFSTALRYKIRDLGAWCDLGKDPIEFISQLIPTINQ